MSTRVLGRGVSFYVFGCEIGEKRVQHAPDLQATAEVHVPVMWEAAAVDLSNLYSAVIDGWRVGFESRRTSSDGHTRRGGPIATRRRRWTGGWIWMSMSDLTQH